MSITTRVVMAKLGGGLTVALCIAVSAGCVSESAAADEAEPAVRGQSGGVGSNLLPRRCPVTAEEVSDAVGRRMKTSEAVVRGFEPCGFTSDSWRTESDVVTLRVARTVTGVNDDKEALRRTNEQLGLELVDLDRGNWGLFGAGGDTASAFVNYGEVHLTVRMNLKDVDRGEFERMVLALIDAATSQRKPATAARAVDADAS